MSDEAGGWKFSQCFGDKASEISEGASSRVGLRRAGPGHAKARAPDRLCLAGWTPWLWSAWTRDARCARSAPRSADIISTVEFDDTGRYLATGDRGGRVVLFERDEAVRDGQAARRLAVVTHDSRC